MGIRETLNQNPAITTGATAAIILVALGIIVWQLMGSSGSGAGAVPNQQFFTVDDGKTWFADDINKIPPFDHNGKPAYQVFVWTCDGGKTKFVSHLQRYTAEAKKKMEEARAKGKNGAPDPGAMEMVMMNGIEVKAAGTGDDPKNWVKQNDPRAAKITDVRCKSGKQEDLEPVLP